MNGENVYLVLYVDDGLIMCKSEHVIKIVLDYMKNSFCITVNKPGIFIGMQIVCDREKNVISHILINCGI